MLNAGGGVGVVNEPFNLARDPGTLRVPVDWWFPYITSENEDSVLPALADLLAFRYPLRRELVKCRNRTQLMHTARSSWAYARSRGRRPLVKEPHAVFSMEWFARRLNSQVVVMVRHPAAVVSSWKRLEWTFDFENLLRQPALLRDWLAPFEQEMREAQRPSSDLVDRISLLWDLVYRIVDAQRPRLPDLHVLRQEDLAHDPLGGFRDLYRALGLELSAAAKAAVVASSGAHNPRELRRDDPHSTMLNSIASLNNWRGRLDAGEVARIRRRTEETAARYYPEQAWDPSLA